MEDTLLLSLLRPRWPRLNFGPAWPVRDVALIDFARHIAMQTPFDLENITADTDALLEALKSRADQMNLPLDRRPLDIDFDALEAFALDWVRTRAAERDDRTLGLNHA